MRRWGTVLAVSLVLPALVPAVWAEQAAPSASTVALEAAFTRCSAIVSVDGWVSDSSLAQWGWKKLLDASGGQRRFKPQIPAIGDFEVFYSPSSKLCTVSYIGGDFVAVEQAAKNKAISLGYTRFNETGMNSKTAKIAEAYVRIDAVNRKRCTFSIGSNATNKTAAIGYYEKALP